MIEPTDKLFSQAAAPRPSAMWFLPVPLLPTAMILSRRCREPQSDIDDYQSHARSTRRCRLVPMATGLTCIKAIMHDFVKLDSRERDPRIIPFFRTLDDIVDAQGIMRQQA